MTNIEPINIHLYPSNFISESRIEKIVSVLSGLNIFNRIYMVGTSEAKLPKYEILDNNIYLCRFGTKTSDKNLLLKLISFAKYYFDTIIYFRRLDIACVNAHSLSVLPLAMVFKVLNRSHIVYDTHELETETHNMKGLRKTLAKVVEKSLIRYVDSVFCVSDEISRWYQRKYNIKLPVTILNSTPVVDSDKSDILRQKLNIPSEAKIILYLGAIENGRGIELMIESFENFNDDKYVLVFVGFGSQINLIKKSKQYCKRIFYLDAVERGSIHLYASSADLGICLNPPTCLSHNYCMPNKLFEYLMASLPVIVSQCESLENFVFKNDVGIVLRSLDPNSVCESIRNYFEKKTVAYKDNARNVALEYSWESQAELLKNEYLSQFN